MDRIYFDNASTTPIDSRVAEKMYDVLKNHFGNPSSIHYYGRKARTIIEDARKQVAQVLGASTGEIFFTSSSTESNNMFLLNSVEDLGVERMISSPTEHHCVLHTLQHIKKVGKAEVVYLEVDHNGSPDLDQLKELLANSNKKTLVSLMHANNEIGTMIDLDEVSELCKTNNALFHSDTTQTVGKEKIELLQTHLNCITASAHKFYGPKGVGFIYMNSESTVRPLIHGGGQERNMRPGTENIVGIVGLAEALRLGDQEYNDRKSHVLDLKNHLRNRLNEEFHDIQYLGRQDDLSLYTILNVSLPPNPKSDMIIMNLDISGICASAGSACSSGAEHASHALAAIQSDPARKAVRFSFSHHNTIDEVNYLIEQLKKLTPVKKTANTF